MDDGVTNVEPDRILIADDHPLVRDGLRTVIAARFARAEIVEAGSLDEAMALLEANGDCDLVLLDVNMPGTGGTAGLQRLRRRFPALPVVMISAEADRTLVAATLAAGAAGFIAKSLRREAIAEALSTVLAGDIYTPADLDQSGESEEIRAIWECVEQLSPQQRIVLGQIVAGKLNKQIAYELDISMATVKAHVSAVLSKLEVVSRTQAAVAAGRIGFVAPGPTT
jgi:DNA-binding NarL/FixJ family response regulator